ncbi:hypothetical protein CG478_019630 [Bacillus cytotoxicus]|nr:hypothetical protein CG483_019610 [Bacillus cytotoxicus]AWC42456.1 hypothetical protein CG480_019630 [Bacillus cytotoxicus]AWC50387.1 hypothetical protein CG478_019630 [Bacillus cytotoxicus]AWC54442.1 hypothetical protein CG477_019810 [Bacillus cytotoxicus]AWC58566.1 hypothetical protein CG476_019835 [Bacillus cytotoxicus]
MKLKEKNSLLKKMISLLHRQFHKKMISVLLSVPFVKFIKDIKQPFFHGVSMKEWLFLMKIIYVILTGWLCTLG